MTANAEVLAFCGQALMSPDRAALAALSAELGLAQCGQALGSSQAALEAEYIRLFLSPTGALCPLWQGAAGDEPRLMGESHLCALDWFRRYDVAPAVSNDPADHAGLLLLFYAQLVEDGDEAPARQFRHAHLDWMPRLCACIAAHTRHAFYREVAQLLESSLAACEPVR